MKKIALFLFSLFLAGSVCSQVRPLADVQEFNRRLAAEAQVLESIESNFIQYKYMDVFDETITSEGKFYYMKKNKINLTYTSPADYVIVINDNRIKIISDGKINVSNLGSNKMMNQMKDMLTACMVGDLSGLSSDYELSYFEDERSYIVKIVPLTREVRMYIAGIDIHFDKKNMSVDKLRLSETETSYTEYHFTGKRFNSLTDEAIFKIP